MKAHGMTLREIEPKGNSAGMGSYIRKLIQAGAPASGAKPEAMLLGDCGFILDRPAAKAPVPQAIPAGESFLTSLASSVDGSLDYNVFRQTHEAAAAAFAAEHGTPSGLAALTACMVRIDEEYIKQDPAGEADADVTFQVALYEASHNTVLAQVMSALKEVLKSSVVANRAQLCHLSGYSGMLRDQHRAIHDAIIRRDPEAAREAASRHLQFSKPL
jgi:GntR family transcriptional repressor for pyruvate dehydrogenase complex